MSRFPNLDTLRFLAASLVILQHIELYKSALYIDSLWHFSFFRIIGNLGVTLFFVLSSFLITTLLMNEQQETGSISLKGFYRRRIMRIWPLYYLIILLGFFVLPYLPLFQMPEQTRFVDVTGTGFLSRFILYFAGVSNLGRTLYGDIAFVSHTWTLATEQLFYLLWPLVLVIFSRRLFIAMVLIIVLYHLVGYFLVSRHAEMVPYSRYMLSFTSGIYIQCMAYGGIFALLLNEKRSVLNVLFHPAIFYSALLIAISLPFALNSFTVFHYDLYSVLFGVVVLNLAANKRYARALENRHSNYWGNISYGIYMFHPILIVVGIRLALVIGSSAVIYILTFFGSCVVAHFSYRYFEGYFLRWSANDNKTILSEIPEGK